MKVAAVFAHLSDMLVGCGGVLSLHSMIGDEVYAVRLVTGKVEGSPGIGEHQERRLLETLGIRKVEFWREHEASLCVKPALVARMRELMFGLDVGLIYTRQDNDVSSDIGAGLVMAAVRRRPVSVLFCETPSARLFVPQLYVDVSISADRKWDVLSSYPVRISTQSPALEELKMHARFRGRQVAVPMAEAFHVDRLVLTEDSLAWIRAVRTVPSAALVQV